jgi:hypothetical protein
MMGDRFVLSGFEETSSFFESLFSASILKVVFQRLEVSLSTYTASVNEQRRPQNGQEEVKEAGFRELFDRICDGWF